MQLLYKCRGVITAVFCVLLLFLPPAEQLQWQGIFLLIFAFFLRIWARMHIGEHTRESKLACCGIVKTGPYRYIKHPLYLSNFAAGAAFALFHTGFSFLTFAFCAVYGIFLAILAINENKFLQEISENTPRNTPAATTACNALWNDRYTWLWQIVIIMLILFLSKTTSH